MIISFKQGKAQYINFNIAEESVRNYLKDQGVDIEKVVLNEMISKLNHLTDSYFYSEAKARGDYLNMGEIIHDAESGDPDATFLKQLYDAVWNKEEELEKELSQMTLDQLLELNLEVWAKEAYDQVKAELESQQTTATESKANITQPNTTTDTNTDADTKTDNENTSSDS